MNSSHTLPPDASIVFLTGAGISAESGLETFRGTGGLWCGQRIEKVATPEAFRHNPEQVHAFYNMRRAGLLNPAVQPNQAHKALAMLEKNWGGDVLVITQNIDNLHERAGVQNLVHMHGELLKAFCIYCSHGAGAKIECHADLSVEDVCPRCGLEGGLRPDIVWFGEMPYHLDIISAALGGCDVFIAIGTSGQVYPAAGFVEAARSAGAITIEMSLEPSARVSAFDRSIVGPAGKTVPRLSNQISLWIKRTTLTRRCNPKFPHLRSHHPLQPTLF